MTSPRSWQLHASLVRPTDRTLLRTGGTMSRAAGREASRRERPGRREAARSGTQRVRRSPRSKPAVRLPREQDRLGRITRPPGLAPMASAERAPSGARDGGEQANHQTRTRSRWDRPPDAVTRTREDGTEPGTTLTGPNAADRTSLLGRPGGTSRTETGGQADDADARRTASAVRRRTLCKVDDREPEPDQTPRRLERRRHGATRFGAPGRDANRITWNHDPTPRVGETPCEAGRR
jgi:hypothetical protein